MDDDYKIVRGQHTVAYITRKLYVGEGDLIGMQGLLKVEAEPITIESFLNEGCTMPEAFVLLMDSGFYDEGCLIAEAIEDHLKDIPDNGKQVHGPNGAISEREYWVGEKLWLKATASDLFFRTKDDRWYAARMIDGTVAIQRIACIKDRLFLQSIFGCSYIVGVNFSPLCQYITEQEANLLILAQED